MARRFDLGMSINYCNNWGIPEAVREFFQNAKDEEVVNPENKMYFDYDADEEILRIGNKSGCLTTNTLLLGQTTKADSDTTIGQFGEGYKVATVVLLRCGKGVKIYNRSKKEIWTAKIVNSKRYQAQVAVYDIESMGIFKSVPDHDLIFEISGITESDYEAITDTILDLQDLVEGTDFVTSGKSRILLSEKFKGKLYVGGLYVAKSKYATLGYDFEPSLVRLDRDRGFIDNLDLQFVTGKVIAKTNDLDLINKTKDIWDGEYIRWYLNSELDYSAIFDDSYESFISKYGKDAIACSTYDESVSLREKGYNAHYVSSNKCFYITSSSKYTNADLVKTKSNIELASELESWFNNLDYSSEAYKTGESIIRDVLLRLRK